MKLEVSSSDYDHGDMAEWGEDTFGHMDDDSGGGGYFDPNYAANPVRKVTQLFPV